MTEFSRLRADPAGSTDRAAGVGDFTRLPLSPLPRDRKAGVPSRATETASVVVTSGLILMAIAMVADSVTTVVRLHSALPYFDEWDSLALFRDLITGQAPWTDMFSQHNEHRIFFPRLFLFSDYLFFGGQGIFDLVTIGAIQAAHAGLLIWLLRRARPTARGSLAIAAVVVMLLSSLRQEENFSWGFQVAFVAVFALATLACILFSDALAAMRAGQAYGGRLIAAYAVVVAATFTMANGLLAGLTLVCLAAASRAPLRIVAASGAVLVILALCYFHGYQVAADQTPLALSLQHPLRLLSYTAIYIGNFLEPDLRTARLLGLWGLVAMAGAAWTVVLRRDTDPVRMALFGIMLFTVGTALLTGLGRLGMGLDQAFSSRYGTGAAAFWSAILIYWWCFADRMRGAALLRWAVGATALVLVVGAVQSQGPQKGGMEVRARGQRAATDALLLGLKDQDSFQAIYDVNGPVLAGAVFLKAHGLSVFGQRDAELVGKPVVQAGTIVDRAFCEGSIDNAAAAPDLGSGGVRLSGRGRAHDAWAMTDRVYLVDGTDAIVGLASRSPDLADPEPWSGFAVSSVGTPLRAFARLSHRKLCELGGAAVVTQ